MTRFQSITAVALVEALLLTGVAFAQGPRGGGPWPGSGGAGLPIRQLNLTEAQQQQVRDIRERHREEMQAAAEKLRAAMTAQRKAVQAIPVDEDLIRSSSREVADAQTEMAIQQAQLHTEVWAVLTPTQQAEAKKLQAERTARFEQRRQGLEQRRQKRNQ